MYEDWVSANPGQANRLADVAFVLKKLDAKTHAQTADAATTANKLASVSSLDPETTQAALEYYQANGGTGAPKADWFSYLNMLHNNSNGYFTQLASSFHSDDLYWRRKTNGSLGSWNKILFNKDISIDKEVDSSICTISDQIFDYPNSTLESGWNYQKPSTVTNRSYSINLIINNRTIRFVSIQYSLSYNSSIVIRKDCYYDEPLCFIKIVDKYRTPIDYKICNIYHCNATLENQLFDGNVHAYANLNNGNPRILFQGYVRRDIFFRFSFDYIVYE